MFTFVEVSKNTYPYRTLHVEGCSHLNRAQYRTVLTLEKVRRLDSVRIDYCSRCVGKTHVGVGGQTEYSAARLEFWAIQRSFKEDEAKTWAKVHAARKVVALRIALEEAEVEATKAFSSAAEQREMVERIYDEAKRGDYSPLEVTVKRRGY
jgi:hypothetical protein